MKKVLFILSMFFCISINAQDTRHFIRDTTITNADTVTFTLSTWTEPSEYRVRVKADSLSGSTAGTLIVYEQLRGGEIWYPVKTTTINGVQTLDTYTGDCISGAIKVEVITSGTQSTRLYLEIGRASKR